MNKTIKLFLCSLLFLSACSNNTDISDEEESLDNNVEKTQEVIWEIKPTLDYDYVVYPNTLEPDLGKYFDDQIYEIKGNPTFLNYRNDVIFAVKQGKFGIYDYDGNVIKEIESPILNKYNPYIVLLDLNTTSETNAKQFQNSLANIEYKKDYEDFINDFIANLSGGYCGYYKLDSKGEEQYIMIYDKDYSSYSSLNVEGIGLLPILNPKWVVLNNEVVNNALIEFDDMGNGRIQDTAFIDEDTLEKIRLRIENNRDKNLLLPIISSKAGVSDEDYYYPAATGLAHYNCETEEITKIEQTFAGSYINGFYAVTDRQPNAGANTVHYEDGYSTDYHNFSLNDNYYYRPQIDDALYGFVDAGTNELITDIEYDDLMYFSEGFAGVHKDGKWAFIDESGSLVSDFLFDDVTPVIDGKSYVQINGYYGILNVKETLDKQIPINSENLMLDEKLKKEQFSLPLGSIICNVDSIKIRDDHSLDSNVIGKMGIQEEIQDAYVYEIYKDEDYLWFRIGENQWVASSLTDNWYTQNVNKKINLEYWN